MYIPKNLAECRVLVAYPIALSRLQQPFISEDLFYLTTVQEPYLKVISFPPNSLVDMEAVIATLPNGWYPDVFIAKVDGCFHLPPVNVSTLKCPKILVLGDTHHGTEPLQRMIGYAHQEKYDLHIADCDRHHLWYYWLAGIENLYWLPTLLIPSPISNFQELPYYQKNLTNASFRDKAIFIGNVGLYHPRRQIILEYLSQQTPDFLYGQLSLEDCFRAFHQASISLNLSLNGDANMRHFEIISAGGFLLSEKLSDETGMSLILEEGKDYETFSDLQELVDKTKYFLANSTLSYRQSSHQKYINDFSPTQCILMLQKLLQGQDVPSNFTTKSIQRIQYFSREKLSLTRIKLYELIQNIHLVWDELTIAIDSQVDFAYVIDFLDLNRLQIIIDDHNLLENIREYLIASHNSSRVKLTNNYLEETFNIIITSTCDPETLEQLGKKNTLIISNDYQGLSMACEYQSFAGLQWDQGAYDNNFFVINSNIDQHQLSLINFITWHDLPVVNNRINNVEILDDLDLREINLLLCPDWRQAEDLIRDCLISALTPIFTSPQVEKIALVICTDHGQEETIDLLVSSVVMNILLQENIHVVGEPGIVFCNCFDSIIWSKILPQIQYRLPLEMDQTELAPEITNLPLWTLQS